MNANEQVRIDMDAAIALTEWKSRFADEIADRAKELAAQSSQPNSVTLSHYRQAAESALQVLSDMIHYEVEPDDRQETA